MSNRVRASIFGTFLGAVSLIGLTIVLVVLQQYKLALILRGGSLASSIWLGILPCLIAAAVAVRTARSATPSATRSLVAVAAGAVSGAVVSLVVFQMLAGMQGLNPLVFAGVLCAAVVAAMVCD